MASHAKALYRLELDNPQVQEGLIIFIPLFRLKLFSIIFNVIVSFQLAVKHHTKAFSCFNGIYIISAYFNCRIYPFIGQCCHMATNK